MYSNEVTLLLTPRYPLLIIHYSSSVTKKMPKTYLINNQLSLSSDAFDIARF